MAETIRASGTGTLSTSGPGVISSVTVSDTTVRTGDTIIVVPTNSVRDADGAFVADVGDITASTSFEVTADRAQLPSDLTFNYIIVT